MESNKQRYYSEESERFKIKGQYSGENLTTFLRSKINHSDLFPALKCMEIIKQRLLIQLEKIQKDLKSGVEIAVKIWRTFSKVKWGHDDLFPASEVLGKQQATTFNTVREKSK